MQQHHYSEGTHILIANHESTYAIKDHLGSIHNNIGINSNFVYTSFFYNPYGRSYRSSQTGTNPDDLRYAGMFYLPEQELYFTRYRAYDASTARWLSRDPIAEQGGINLYGYVGGNFVNAVDPLGLDTTMVCRSINDWRISWTGMVHCAVFVFHWETDKCNNKKKVIDSQYSVAGGQTPLTNPKSPTYIDDRNAFNLKGDSQHYPITPATPNLKP